MTVLDRQKEVFVGVDEHAVGVRERTFSPRGQEIAVAVQNNERVRPPVEEVHPVLGVGDYGRLPQLPSIGQFLPVFHLFVGVLAVANRCHAVASLSSLRYSHVVGQFLAFVNCRDVGHRDARLCY